MRPAYPTGAEYWRSVRRLFIVETVTVAAFVGVAAWVQLQEPEAMATIAVEALATGPAEEAWSGIFLKDQHVGWSVTKESPVAGGGRLIENRASFVLGAQGASQEVTLGGTAITDAAGRLVEFDFVLETLVSLRAHGVVRPGVVHVEVEQGGTTQTLDIPVDEPPALSLTATQFVRGKELNPGDRFEQPYFDIVTMRQTTMTVVVEAPELMPDGSVAHWLRMEAPGLTTRRLVSESGAVLREEDTTLGVKQVRMTREQALAVDAGAPPDLVAVSKVPLGGFVDRSRPFGPLSLRVTGLEAPLPDEGDVQRVAGDVVTLWTPDPTTWPVLPVRGSGDVEPTFSLPADHEEIVARARKVVGDAPDRATAARRIHDFVHGYLTKAPTIGIPNGLEVLRSGQGDCNEHTALYVSLARAEGIPSRIAAGLVYNEALGSSFYYHAWPEVRLGADEAWVPIDPTFGQFPAHATHLKIVTGDLDKQMRILGLIGRLRIDVATEPPR